MSDTIKRFEDLIAWKKSRILVRDIYTMTKKEPFSKDFILVQQIRRSAVSITANIAEGFERAGLGEFHRFLTIAKASCAETRSHLYLAFDAGYLDKNTFEILILQSEEIGKIIGGLRATVQRKRDA